jgi:steroid delta-isomerase-like uncharacterized protein
MTTDPVSVARSGVEAYNSGDMEQFRSLLTPDSVYREFATGREIRGVDGIIEANQGWNDAFPGSSGEITNAFGSGDQAVLQIVWTGTHKGDLVTPNGTIPATGKQVRIPACQVVTVTNGKITATDHYFDSMTMLSQLGVLPAEQMASTT